MILNHNHQELTMEELEEMTVVPNEPEYFEQVIEERKHVKTNFSFKTINKIIFTWWTN